MKKAVYAGSFDPITNGHVWMVEKGRVLFDELVVAIGENPDKRYTFTTLFLMPPREIAEVSSSLVKGLVGPTGWQEIVRRYVPETVYELLIAKYDRSQS